jgi:carboxyl-terminal processing protease
MCQAKNFLAVFVVWTVAQMGPIAPGQDLLPPVPPAPDPLPPPTKVSTAPTFSTYHQNLLSTLDVIEQHYIRPVSRAELLVAALSGLYEAGGESPPTNLRVDVEKAIKAKLVARLLEQAKKQARRLNDEEALLASCRGMLRTLDPFCEVLIGDEGRRATGRMDNHGAGVDLEDTGAKGPFRISEVLPGGPAQKAGLRPGDRLLKIHGTSLRGMDMLVASGMLNAVHGVNMDAGKAMSIDQMLAQFPSRTKVPVVIERESEPSPLELLLDVGEFHAESVFGVQRLIDNSWYYWLDRDKKIAHVRIGSIRDGTDDDLREALHRLEKEGMRGLLLDLRGCPGGLLTPANNIAGMFLDKGTVAYRKMSGKATDAQFQQVIEEEGPFCNVLVLVLVNHETSGGGELIAAALQESNRAKIAGQRTRGKASVQVMHPLPIHGAYLKLTSLVFVTAKGKNLHRFPDSKLRDDWGVRPDDGLEFRVSPAMNQQVREWWVAQTLRPGSSRERLPLDDPENDPQRQLALQALRERLK